MIRNIERLLFIEARLILHKCIVRRDLTFTFRVAPATATRDISDYRALAPNNMVLQQSPIKAWCEGKAFQAVLFEPSPAASIEQQASVYLGSLQQIVTTCATCHHTADILQHETIDTMAPA